MNQFPIIVLDESRLEEIVQRILIANHASSDKKVEAENSKPLLTVAETCAMLSISRVTLHTWKKSGRLPYHRIGHRVYFKPTEILAAMKPSTELGVKK